VNKPSLLPLLLAIAALTSHPLWAQPSTPPPVSDPMLAPPPPAPHQVRSWDEAIALVRAHSPDYLSGFETIERAAAQSRIALAAVLPTLSAQGTYAHQFFTLSGDIPGLGHFVSPVPDVFAVSGVFQWNVLSPRAIYGVGTAHKSEQVAKLSFQDRRRELALLVANVLLDTLATEKVAELNRAGLRAALERLVLTQTRLRFGQGTPLDVDRAQQDVAAARALVITGDESLRRSREALGQALGSPTPTSAPGDLRLDDLEAAVARTCRLNNDLERRPDVAAARSRVELAQRGVHDAWLLFAPSLSLTSEVTQASAAVLAPQTTWGLGLVLSVPLYDGGARYSQIRDSRAALEQARQALVAARVNAVVSSAQAGRSVSVSDASRRVAAEQRDLAARIDERTRDGYARGAGTSLDLVVSAQSLRQAEINLAVLDVQTGQARAAAVLTNAECFY
jgi:outer membrane protein, multidrug efflux system